MHIITPQAPAPAAPTVATTDQPFSLLRQPYKPLTMADRIKIELDMRGVEERLQALLATMGGAHV